MGQTELHGEGPEEEENGEKQMSSPSNHTRNTDQPTGGMGEMV